MELNALHMLSYGVYIVAAEANGRKRGFVANTVFQVTSSPPRLAISCNTNNTSLPAILESMALTVSVLADNTPASLIGEFGYMSGADYDKFTRVTTMKKKTGAPVVIDSAIAWFDCSVEKTLALDTHVLIVCRVEDCAVLSETEPLTYQNYRKKYKASAPRNAPTYLSTDPDIPVSPEEKANVQPSGMERQEKFDEEPYICQVCGYIYHPEDGDPPAGIEPGTSFSSLPEDYRCPVCNAGKDYFRPMF
jgi:flavin reductase (DIM6/NTAB) family NADH-FMN oxidoreductase RutF/rubredoxin